jgi:hypothetical protein
MRDDQGLASSCQQFDVSFEGSGEVAFQRAEICNQVRVVQFQFLEQPTVLGSTDLTLTS